MGRVLAVVLALGLLLGVPAAVLAQGATPPPDDLFRDPDGRYEVPVPTNWTAEAGEGYGVLRDPEGELAVYAVAVEATAAEDGIVAAWGVVDPVFDAASAAVEAQTVPSSPGVEETVVVAYAPDGADEIVQAVGQRIGGRVYVLLFRGTLAGAQRRSSQLQVIQSGFRITGVAERDLSGVAPTRLKGPVRDEFAAYVGELLGRLEVPGAAVAVVQGGEVVFAEGFGVRELGGTEPVTAETRMMIGSTTKSMTTMMMATLVDQGALAWDTPVVEVLPEFAVADPELTRTITVRDLMCACTGVPRRDLELIFNADQLSAEETVASLAEFEFYTAFGEAFQYSNQMVATGGFAAAAAAGGVWGGLADAYVAEIQERVFDPIGMAQTTFSFAEVAADGGAATPHGAGFEAPGQGEPVRAAYAPIPLAVEETLVPIAPAGAAWSTAADMARYLITQIEAGVGPEGNRVVSAANLAETWAPQVEVSAESDYGLGWFVEDYDGLRVIHHGGNTFGFTSDFAFLPEAGIGVVTLANAQGANLFTEGVRYRLLELLYDRPMENDAQVDFAIEQAETAFAELAPAIEPLPSDEAAAMAGRYANPTLGEVAVRAVGDRLLLDTGEFAMGLLRFADPARPEARLVIAYDPPLAGTPLEVVPAMGAAQELVIDTGVERYVFARVGAAASPTASPEASPVPSPVAVLATGG